MRWGRYAIILLSLLLVGLPSTVQAKEPRTYPASGVLPFLGLDDTSAPTQVKDGRAQDLQNVNLSLSMDLRKRYGASKVGSNNLDLAGEDWCAATGLYYTKFSSGTERIVSTCGTRFYYLSGTTWTVVNKATPITGGQNNQFVFTTALDSIIGTNNTDVPVRWAGGTSDLLSPVTFTGLSSPIQKAKTVAFFKNYLIFGNTQENSTAYPTRIRWSNVGTINTWTDADYIDIGAMSGQEINGMAELYDNLYIFLTDSIYKVSLVGGSDLFQVSKVTEDIGSIAKNSIQTVTLSNSQNGLMFLDKDKYVFFFNGVVAQNITQLLRTTMNGLSGSRLQYAVSADTGKDYLLCTTNSTGSTNDLCLDFQYEIGEWTKHTNIPANAMAHVLDSNSDDQVYWGSYKSMVYQYQDADNRDDVGSAEGTVSAVQTYTTSTASSLQVLYINGANYVTGALTGAPIEIVGGTAHDETNTLAYNTYTGLVVTNNFTTKPDTTSTFEVGAIDAYYTTKWYDMGDAARLKHFGEVYFWADADVSSTHTLAYATDFNSDISTLSLSLSESTTDAIWGSAIWGVSLWGSGDTVFRNAKLESQGRFLRLKWSDDDPDEVFRIYGWSPVYWAGDIN